MIALALANGPELLIADEPTPALDVPIHTPVRWPLAALPRAPGIALLFITPFLAVLRAFSGRFSVVTVV